MYRYDEFDRAFVNERVAQFRDQVARRMTGEIDEDQFKPLRLQNGVYLQLHAYMLRIAIPYGTLNPSQVRHARAYRAQLRQGLRPLHHAAEPAVQLAALKDVPDILQNSPTVEMHCIQTSAATASGTSPPTISPASPPTRSPTRGPMRRSSGSGRRSTRNSCSCRENSRSR